MASEFKYTRRVEFSDTDMAGIMNFMHYFAFMEAAETAFLRSLGLSVMPKPKDVAIGWPRVAVGCEYKKPFRFEDEVEITLKVAKKSEKSVSYVFIFRKAGAPDEHARGTMTTVCCTFRDGRMQATLIPKEFGDKLDVAKDV